MQKNLNIEKIVFKVVQMKFLAMHITNQKLLSFDIFTVGNLQNIFMEHDLYLNPNDFWHKIKINNFDPYNVFLAIATNIPQRLKTGFVVQGHTRVLGRLQKWTFFCWGQIDPHWFPCNLPKINTLKNTNESG